MINPPKRIQALGAKKLAGTLTSKEEAELDAYVNGKSKATKKALVKYSDAIADEVCDLIKTGKTLRYAAEQLGIPFPTLYEWSNKREYFTRLYAGAREIRKIHLEDEMLDTIREIGEAGQSKKNSLLVNALTNKASKLQWVIQRMLPREYGDRQRVEMTGKDGAPLLPTPSEGQLTAFAEKVAAARKKIEE